MSFAVGQWQEVAVTEDGIRLFPGRPGTTTMDAMLPSHFGPALDHAAQEGRGNIRISSSHVQHVRPFSIPQRATIDEQMALRAAAQSVRLQSIR